MSKIIGRPLYAPAPAPAGGGGQTKLSGTWVPSAIWKNVTLLPQSIAYTASVSEAIECHVVNTNGYEYNIINMRHVSEERYAIVETDDGEVYDVYLDEGLASSAFSALTFAAPQTVSADFYAWFTAAFTKQS